MHTWSKPQQIGHFFSETRPLKHKIAKITHCFWIFSIAAMGNDPAQSRAASSWNTDLIRKIVLKGGRRKKMPENANVPAASRNGPIATKAKTLLKTTCFHEYFFT